MDALSGFVSVPRVAGFSPPAGAFFSAVVEAQVGPGVWRIRMDGETQVVRTDLGLVTGQILRLKVVEQAGPRWLLQIVPGVSGPLPTAGFQELTPLMAAFLSQGLPLVPETLSRWARWMTQGARPSDKEAWAASLEARASSPGDPGAAFLEPWLAWQQALEEGRSPPPPGPEDDWDLWNLRAPAKGSPWLIWPLRWTYEGSDDYGLLQARWNAPAQQIDRWNLTASPGVAFRLEAEPGPGTLALTWRFFQESDRLAWAGRTVGWAEAFSSENLTVSLEVTGAAGLVRPRLRSIDVQA